MISNRRIRILAELGTLVAVVLLLGPLPTNASTNDPLLGRQWGLSQIHAEEAWATSKGAGIKIAVIDSGVDMQHPDLAGKVIPGPDYVNNDADPQDDHNHGTHVSGIAAATMGNGEGIAGVAPDSKILAIKVLGADGSGSGQDVAEAIKYAADQKAEVINLSLGNRLDFLLHDATIDKVIDYAYKQGVVVVVAAGNSGVPFTDPATANITLVVGATNKSDEKASYSQSGAGVRIYAPGGQGVGICDQDPDIWSSVRRGKGGCGQSNYSQFRGTSMATPHVAGVAALVRAANASLTAKQVMDLLLSTADTVGVLGLKRVNAAKAVAAAKSAGGGGGSGTGGSSGGGPTGGGSTGGGSLGGTGSGAAKGTTAAAPKATTGAATSAEPVPGQALPTAGDSKGDRSGGEHKPRGNALGVLIAVVMAAGIIGVFAWSKWKATRSLE